MDVHASTSHSHQKTSNSASTSGEGPSSASVKQTQNAWVEHNPPILLKAIAKWTRADRHKLFIRTETISLYTAKERSDKNLQYILGIIHKRYGPLDMRYEGCDTLAEHWISGWDSHSVPGKSEEKVMICVDMGERLPGQAPALDRLWREIHAESDEEKNNDNTDSDEEKNKEKDHDSVDSEDEENLRIDDLDLTEEEIAEFEEEANEEDSHEKSEWVDVDKGGIEDSKCIRSNDRATVIKDAGRMLLDGFRKL